MKKHLIAAAVAAAVAVPAMAQVTISGTLDVRAFNDAESTVGAVTSSSGGTDGNTGSGTLNAVDGFSTSQIVFSGTEDLGGGLKAGFLFVQRLGTGLEARDRALFLQGGFGEVRIGRFNPSVTGQFLGLSGLASTGNAGSFYGFATNGSGFGVSAAAAAGSFGAGSHERDNGTIQYTSPAMSGMTVSLGFRDNSAVADTTLAAKTETKQTYGTLTFAQGPLSAGVGYSKRDAFGTFATPIGTLAATTAATTGTEATELSSELTWAGGGYDFGVARVNVMLAKVEAELASAARNDASLQAISLTAPIGAFTLSGSFYRGSDHGAVVATDDIDTNGYQLSARYALSKRTFAYLITGEAKNERAGSNVTALAARKVSQSGVGLVHNF